MSEIGNSRDANGRFLPGNKIGPGRGGKEARVKGEIREKLLDAINMGMDQFEMMFNMLSPKERIDALTALMKYAVPAQNGHELQSGQIINISLSTPDLEIHSLLNGKTEEADYTEIQDEGNSTNN